MFLWGSTMYRRADRAEVGCALTAHQVLLEYRPILPSVLSVVLAKILNQTESSPGSSWLHSGDPGLLSLSLEILF